MENFVYLVGDPDKRVCAVVDPAWQVDTIMKTAHGVTDKRHAADYGANARHVSDLSDPDLNWFVLFGDQDGWFRSSTFTSQVPLWLEGGSIQVPLRMETVRRSFRHKILLKPAR